MANVIWIPSQLRGYRAAREMPAGHDADAERASRTENAMSQTGVVDDNRTLLGLPQAPDAIELRHLRAFVAVAEDLSFSRAAQRLFITQPALSRQIRALERLVGCDLFRRAAHRIELTLAGESLLARGRALLADLDDAITATRSVGGELTARMARLWEPWVHASAHAADLDDVRAAAEELHLRFAPPPGVTVTPVIAGGVPALRLTPEKPRDATVLHLHGGGYIAGSAFGYRHLAGAIAACTGRKLDCRFRPGLSRGGPVLVEQSAQTLPASDPVDPGRERDHVRFVFGSTQKHSVALVAAPGVVMGDVDVEHVVEVAFSGDEDPVGAFSADGADPALGEGVHPLGLRCGERDLDADGGKDRVEGGTELRVTVANQVSESVPGLLQITGKTAGQLNCPVPGRMLGNAEQVDSACLDLDDERDIQPLQRHGVDVEEIDRKQAAGLGAQQGAPGVVAARGWRDPAGTQDLADGRGGGPMVEATQLALDANHTPGPVLPRQAHDQGGQFVADRRTTRRLRLPPPRGDQPAVPAQQRSRRDNPVGV